jgi:hypothetical protein
MVLAQTITAQDMPCQVFFRDFCIIGSSTPCESLRKPARTQQRCPGTGEGIQLSVKRIKHVVQRKNRQEEGLFYGKILGIQHMCQHIQAVDNLLYLTRFKALKAVDDLFLNGRGRTFGHFLPCLCQLNGDHPPVQ